MIEIDNKMTKQNAENLEPEAPLKESDGINGFRKTEISYGADQCFDNRISPMNSTATVSAFATQVNPT